MIKVLTMGKLMTWLVLNNLALVALCIEGTHFMITGQINYFCFFLLNRKRMTAQQCMDHRWLAEDAARMKTRRINTANLKRFMARRKWQVSRRDDSLTLSTLGKIFSRQHFEIFFLFFPENRI